MAEIGHNLWGHNPIHLESQEISCETEVTKNCFKQLDDNTGWILEYGKQKHFLLDSYTKSNKYRSGTYFLYNKPFIWTLNKNVFNLPDLNISDNQTTFNSRICSKYYTSANSNFPARPYFQMPTWLPRFSQFRHTTAEPESRVTMYFLKLISFSSVVLFPCNHTLQIRSPSFT